MKVPVQDGLAVGADVLPGTQMNAPSVPDFGALPRRFGAAAQQAGDVAARLADEVNKTIVGEALAKLQDAADRRRLDPETGFASLLGANAMNRPDGKPLTEEYGGYFDEDYHAIAAGLKNGRQREIFAQAAQGVRQGYMRQVSAHMLTQGRKAVGESLESQSVLNLRAFQLASGGDERQQAFERFGASVDKLAAMNGWTPEKVLAEKQAAFGRAFAATADAMIDAGDFDGAAELRAGFGTYVSADVLLRVEKAVEAGRQQEAADNAVFDGATYTVNLPVAGGQSIWRAESANHSSMNGERGLNFDGLTTEDVRRLQSRHTAPGGATGAAGLFQIMPATLREAGGKIPSGMRWTRENQINYVGRYLVFDKQGKTVGSYIRGTSGDREAAINGMAAEWAGFKGTNGRGAYDGIQGNRATVGAEAVGAALDRAREAFRQAGGGTDGEMAAMRVLVAGGGGVRKVTFDTRDPEALRVQLNAWVKDPKQRKMIEADIGKRQRVWEQAQRQQEAERDVALMRDIMASGGDYGSLPRSTRAALERDDPKKAMQLRNFADGVRKQNQDEAFAKNQGAYHDLLLNPAKLSDTTEEQLLSLGLSIGYDKAQKLVEAKRREEKAKQEGRVSPLKINQGVITSIAGIYQISKKDNPEWFYALSGNVHELAATLRAELGRDPTEEELVIAARKMQAQKVVTEKGWLWDTEQSVLALTAAEKRKHEGRR